eukprot:976831-Rhodomonas_salina.1
MYHLRAKTIYPYRTDARYTPIEQTQHIYHTRHDAIYLALLRYATPDRRYPRPHREQNRPQRLITCAQKALHAPRVQHPNAPRMPRIARRIRRRVRRFLRLRRQKRRRAAAIRVSGCIRLGPA